MSKIDENERREMVQDALGFGDTIIYVPGIGLVANTADNRELRDEALSRESITVTGTETKQ